MPTHMESQSLTIVRQVGKKARERICTRQVSLYIPF